MQLFQTDSAVTGYYLVKPARNVFGYTRHLSKHMLDFENLHKYVNKFQQHSSLTLPSCLDAGLITTVLLDFGAEDVDLAQQTAP